jgi:cell division protein FtsW
MSARRPFAAYLAAGITLMIAFQALLIMGGVTKLLPLTGVTLPFISYGGSSLLICSIMLGLVMNISAESATSATPAAYG